MPAAPLAGATLFVQVECVRGAIGSFGYSEEFS